jgi:hypothetical protein
MDHNKIEAELQVEQEKTRVMRSQTGNINNMQRAAGMPRFTGYERSLRKRGSDHRQGDKSTEHSCSISQQLFHCQSRGQ